MFLKKINYKIGFIIKRIVNLLIKGIKGLLGFCFYYLVVFLKGFGYELNCLFFYCLVFIVFEKLFFNNYKELSVSCVSCGGFSKMEGL